MFLAGFRQLALYGKQVDRSPPSSCCFHFTSRFFTLRLCPPFPSLFACRIGCRGFNCRHAHVALPGTQNIAAPQLEILVPRLPLVSPNVVAVQGDDEESDEDDEEGMDAEAYNAAGDVGGGEGEEGGPEGYTHSVVWSMGEPADGHSPWMYTLVNMEVVMPIEPFYAPTLTAIIRVLFPFASYFSSRHLKYAVYTTPTSRGSLAVGFAHTHFQCSHGVCRVAPPMCVFLCAGYGWHVWPHHCGQLQHSAEAALQGGCTALLRTPLLSASPHQPNLRPSLSFVVMCV